MALLANQLMDSARLLSVMNGRVDPLPQFLRVQNQGHMTHVNATQEDTRKSRKYPCPLCGKRFRFNSILSLHMRTHTGEKPFKCPYCDHRAAQKGNLKIHLRTHKQGNLGKGSGRIREENRLLHELEERAILRDRHVRGGLPQPLAAQPPQPHAASTTVQLPLTFTVPGPVETPSLSSTSVKMTTTGRDDHTQALPTAGFRCSFCKGKFRKKQELERHIRILHKPYKCTLCEFAASQEEDLISHVETAHIASESPQSQRPTLVGSGRGVKPPNGEFPCEVCGQTFSQAWFLKGHMRKHKDSFEHCCQICSRRFKEPWFLKNHMKVHLNKLAAKTKQLRPNSSPADSDMSFSMAGVGQDSHHLYSQYVSSLHSRFLSGERAGHSEFQKILATADIGMKVKEMLGRMLAPRNDSLMERENDHSLLGLNHLLPPLSSSGMEYHLRASANERDNLNSYLGWQVMASGLARGQVELHTAEEQQWAYLAERRVSLDKQQASVNDPEIQAVSRPGSPELTHVLNGSCTRPQTASTQDDNSIPSSPVLGEEKPYSDHTSTQSASLSYHLKGYQQPQWNQDTRDIRNSSSSQTASPKDWSPATGLYSRPEDPDEGEGNQATLNMDRLAPNLPNPSSLHQAYGPPAMREDSMNPPGLHRSIQSFINGLTTSMLRGGRKRRAAGARVSTWCGGPGSAEGEERVGAGGSGRGGEGESVATHSTNRSQYEPLDLSLRPDWLLSSPAASAHNSRPPGGLTGLLQPHSPGSNGPPSSSTNGLQAPTGQHKAQSDWSEPGSGAGCDPGTPTEQEAPNSYDSSAQDTDGALENPVSDSTEGHERPDKQRRRRHCTREAGLSEEVTQMMADCLRGCPEETQEQWSRSVIRTLLSPPPLRKPRQTPRQQPPRDLLSVLQSSIRHNQTLLNGGGLKEGAEILGGKPFQCKYCPYSATQKGNLKTHVLCVHRRPFDSSLYPDRRLRRPHANPVLTQQGSTGSSYFPKSMGLEKAARSAHSGRDLIMTSTCGT